MSTPHFKFTAATRATDEVEYFAGLNGAPVEPTRLAAADRLLMQVAYATGTGVLLGIVLGLVHLARHGWTL